MSTPRRPARASTQPKILERAITQINMKVIDRLATPLGIDGADGYHINFSILGNTGNIYSVIFNLTTGEINPAEAAITCTCPYYSTHHQVCKHIYVVYIKVFRIIPDIISSDPNISLGQRKLLVNLFKNYITENIAPPVTSIESRTGMGLRPIDGSSAVRNSGPDDECPVCFEKLASSRNYVCHQCRNSIHNDCMREVIKYNKHCPLCRGDIMDSLVALMDGMAM